MLNLKYNYKIKNNKKGLKKNKSCEKYIKFKTKKRSIKKIEIKRYYF